MNLTRALDRSAQRVVTAAATAAALLGGLSLWVTLTLWRERRHLDAQLLLGLLDGLLVLALAYGVWRRRSAAAWALLGLAVAGAAVVLASGRPWPAVLPQAVGALFYLRAIRALRRLRRRPPR